jgi:hypothetical protein
MQELDSEVEISGFTYIGGYPLIKFHKTALLFLYGSGVENTRQSRKPLSRDGYPSNDIWP